MVLPRQKQEEKHLCFPSFHFPVLLSSVTRGPEREINRRKSGNIAESKQSIVFAHLYKVCFRE